MSKGNGKRMAAEMESPNTVSGLIAKRDELVRVRDRLADDLRRITCDIDHLEGAIRIFNPENTPEAAQRYILKYRAKGGHLTRHLLDRLREAGKPLTTFELVEGWMAERGIPSHQATHVIMRRRVGAAILHLRRKGVIRSVSTGKKHALYELVRD